MHTQQSTASTNATSSLYVRTFCPVCSRSYDNLRQHIRDAHPSVTFTNEDLQGTGLQACPTCHAPYKQGRGLTSHVSSGRCHSRPLIATTIPPIPTSGDRSINDTLSTLSTLPVTRKPLAASIARLFTSCASRAASAFLRDPSDQTLLVFMAIPKIALTAGLKHGPGYARRRLALFPNCDWSTAHQETNYSGNTQTAVQRLVQQGRLGAAARTLTGQSQVAKPTPPVIEALKALHPTGPEDPFGTSRRPQPFQSPLDDDIFTALKSMKTDTTPGVSGWTVALLRQASRAQPVRAMLSWLCTAMLNGTAPGQPLLCASRLTPLDKPDGGIRPIAVGEVIYQLLAKVLLRTGLQQDNRLAPFQFGVNTPGGVEPIVRALDLAVQGTIPTSYITALDFSNAFNTLDRRTIAQATRSHAIDFWRLAKWAYGDPSHLYLPDGSSISSSQGVRQGCPLAPFLFSVGVRSILEQLRTALGPDYSILAYLDDVYILGPEPAQQQVTHFLNSIQSPLKLNLRKTEAHSVDHIRRQGIKVLGTCIGPAEVRQDFLSDKISLLSNKLSQLRGLPSQHAFLLLKYSLQQELRHLQRSLDPTAILPLWGQADKLLWTTISKLARTDQDFLPADAVPIQLCSLPAKLGGLGIFSHEKITPLARLAANDNADRVLAPLFPMTRVIGPLNQLSTQNDLCAELWDDQLRNLLATITPAEQVLVTEASSPIARKWLSSIPYAYGTSFTDAEYATGLRYRLLLQPEGTCPRCGEVRNLSHDEVCIPPAMAGRWRVSRHEGIKYALADALRSLHDSVVETEPFLWHDTRRDDVKFTSTSASGLPNLVIDITCPSLASARARSLIDRPFQQDSEPNDQVFRLATEYLAARGNDKRSKHDQVDPGHTFQPFVISCGGLMDQDTAAFLRKLKTSLSDFAYTRMIDRMSAVLVASRDRTTR